MSNEVEQRRSHYHPKHIIVVEAGWVFSGDVVEGNLPDTIAVENAAVIRKWGTTDGLGQLAYFGTTDETELDFCTAPAIPKSKILFILPVVSPAWNDK